MDVAAAQAVGFDTPVNGSLNPVTSIALHRLIGSKGGYYNFNATQGDSGGNWILYGVNNDALASPGNGTDFGLALQMDGEYVPVLSRYRPASGLLCYRVKLNP